MNRDNIDNVRHEDRTSGTRMKNVSETKLMGLKQTIKTKTLDTFRGINEFKEGYQLW